MAEIHLCAMTTDGPGFPSSHGVWLKDVSWPGGGTVKHLMLAIGDSTIDVWPADKDEIISLGQRLIKIAEKL